MENFTVSTIL